MHDQIVRPTECSESEHSFQNDTLGTLYGKASGSIGDLRCNPEIDKPRIRITYTLFLTRPLDPEDICTKFFTDTFIYASVLVNDRSYDVEIRTQQVLVDSRKEEGTGVEIAPAEPN